jgi:5-methyltetrahydrofolate--homocysteine methyltransferase
MSDLNEVKAAVEGARSVSQLPITVTMSFDTNGRTMMGVTATQALQTIQQWDVFGVGGNCGNTLDETFNALQAMYSADPEIILISKPNAGIPHWHGSELIYSGTPEIMAGYARQMASVGARLIGACCGSTPAHIRAMAEALKNPLPLAERPPADITPSTNGTPSETTVKPNRERRTRRNKSQ